MNGNHLLQVSYLIQLFQRRPPIDSFNKIEIINQNTNIIDITFQTVYDLFNWKEIKNCPGRYTLRKGLYSELSSFQFITQIIGGNKKINNQVVELKYTKGLKDDTIFIVFFKDKLSRISKFHTNSC